MTPRAPRPGNGSRNNIWAQNRNDQQNRGPGQEPRNTPPARGGGVTHSTAPYNFIPFGPVVTASQLWPKEQALHRRQATRVPETLSGHIDLQLRPLTPLHIGGGADPDTLSVQRRGRSLLWPDTTDGIRAWIPGSTLRNNIRATLESILGAPITPSDTPITFRAPFTSDEGQQTAYSRSYWNTRRVTKITNEKVGILLPKSGWLVPSEKLKLAWTDLDKPESEGGLGVNDFLGCSLGELHQQPDLDQKLALLRDHKQFTTVHVIDDRKGRGKLSPPLPPSQGHPYALLLTGLGRSEGQKNAYAVRVLSLQEIKERKITPLQVPKTVLDDAASGWTEYQRLSLPAAETWGQGHLIPVFYDTAPDGTVAHIGFSSGFRIVARNTVKDAAENAGATLWPDGSREEDLCAVAALFGTVEEKAGDGESYAVASRISFGHALTEQLDETDDDDDVDVEKFFESRQNVTALAPKPQAFHTRLRQPDGRLVTYDTEGAQYRGREVYLHRWDPNGATTWESACDAHRATGGNLAAEGGAYGEPESNSNRPYRPLKAGNLTFHARVRFTNLSEPELGALLYALTLGDSQQGVPERPYLHAHKLGGLRALGLGSVGIRTELHLKNPARHHSWDAAPVCKPDSDRVDTLVHAFRDACTGLGVHTQLDAVERATRWVDRAPFVSTKEMSLTQHALRNPLEELTELFSSEKDQPPAGTP
jgi:CRISPR-associated protein (TIGR03986 family)